METNGIQPILHVELNMCDQSSGEPSKDRSRKKAIEDELRDPSNFLE